MNTSAQAAASADCINRRFPVNELLRYPVVVVLLVVYIAVDSISLCNEALLQCRTFLAAQLMAWMLLKEVMEASRGLDRPTREEAWITQSAAVCSGRRALCYTKKFPIFHTMLQLGIQSMKIHDARMRWSEF